ncbi:MAG: hypothetical protein ACYCO3_15095, partial [Mycobacteriales bacterium]
FDHTSMLRFLETRFGVAVPNLTSWRRSVTGDLTAAFSFGLPPRVGLPTLPATSLSQPNVVEECATTGVTGTEDQAPPYPIPKVQVMPGQEPGRPRAPVTSCPAPIKVSRGEPAGQSGSRATPGSPAPESLALTGGEPAALPGLASLLAGLGLAFLARRRGLAGSTQPEGANPS